ncbi:hypothetical protein [Rhodohalobacter sp. 8-1]|uniref:hypothetical protein n=1 Tax=Rhodohalobacter sp. 8-1 TaxID=3131972 RepID=UPI0030EEEFAE
MKKIHVVVILMFLVSACGGEQTDITPQVEAETVQGEFFANLFERCGETFSGQATYPEDPDNELVGVNLVATIQTCTEEEIRIALNAGGDLSRTWVISRTDDGLHLRHDHRDQDGTPHEVTNYGGFATDEGTATRQYFAADDTTKEMIPEAETNVWMMEIEDNSFTYYLERNGEPRFRAELTQD